ncbi:hypothetical protein ANN_22315 [Periplaneta americana]|uniref:Reverse transcriptase domain-containing protein n=1 Tax=Periplaneta americana TaxID=6978 RepID=A0ABQ8S802_PERAM|nr:hypothetical protein ANN_22315 [Periplaneta americana]
MGIINTIMKPSLVQRHTRICLYKTLARPVLCYGSEEWTLREKDESRITANEMKFMRYTAGYTKWDHKRNEDVMEELQLEPSSGRQHSLKWAKGKRSNVLCPVVQQEEVKSVPASSYECTIVQCPLRGRKRDRERSTKGYSLSYTLVYIYLEDLVKNCFENMGGVIVGGRRIKCIRFVDMALLAEEEMILRDMLLELSDRCEQYGMKINANKTKNMAIGRKVKKLNLRILNEAVQQVDSFNST